VSRRTLTGARSELEGIGKVQSASNFECKGKGGKGQIRHRKQKQEKKLHWGIERLWKILNQGSVAGEKGKRTLRGYDALNEQPPQETLEPLKRD